MAIQAILTDIEGTTSSVDFVYQSLFPYARAHLPGFVAEHANEPAVQQQLEAVRQEVADRGWIFPGWWRFCCSGWMRT